MPKLFRYTAACSVCAVAAMVFLLSSVEEGHAGNACSIGGWSIDQRADGLAVRAGPGGQSDVVGKLPPFEAFSGGLHWGRGAEFLIAEARDGWFRIYDVYLPRIYREDDSKSVEWELSELEGWIPGDAIYFVLQTTKGFSSPDPDSETVFSSDDWYGPNDWLAVTDCQGQWVQIAYGTTGQEKRAWFRGVCMAQETTCDGVSGD